MFCCTFLHHIYACNCLLQGFYLTIVLLLGITVTTIVGRPTGAPATACSTVAPNHTGTSASTDPFAYFLNYSSLNGGYMPGQTYTST